MFDVGYRCVVVFVVVRGVRDRSCGERLDHARPVITHFAGRGFLEPDVLQARVVNPRSSTYVAASV